jgi:hypothetical protein
MNHRESSPPNKRRSVPPPSPSAKRASGRGAAWVASALGFTAAAGIAGAVTWATGAGAMGCGSDDTSDETASRSSAVLAPPGEPEASASPVAAADADSGVADEDPQPEEEKPWEGPWLGVMAFQTPIYAEPRFDKRIGYVRKGGKVPVESETPIKKDNCKKGWYRLVDGGYVCGKYATTDLDDAKVRLGVTAPDLEAIVPYKYAYNRKNGTPLYKSVPTREDMLTYEPYLEKTSKPASEDGASVAKTLATEERSDDERHPAKQKVGEAGEADFLAELGQSGEGATEEAEVEEPPKAWWEQEASDEKVEVTLAELESDADSNLAKRMVKGFFIAVDKTFGWNDRLWYKTTGGLVAPADRMYINKPPEVKGMPFPEGAKAVGFMRSAKAFKYHLAKDEKSVKKGDQVERFTPFGLTGKVVQVDSSEYRETQDGWWMKSDQGTFTEPGARPSEVREDEKWIDVNLSRRTLVAFEGDKPIYAALISPGKKSRNRKKDHSTPTGKWRIREKHISVTMDGDGASGDLPYSIDDVPYVAYYKGSYAIHGAFWHQNFGYDMSHGCVNLAPLDAKEMFQWSEPRLPRGWHAVFATDDRPGTMVVAHE